MNPGALQRIIIFLSRELNLPLFPVPDIDAIHNDKFTTLIIVYYSSAPSSEAHHLHYLLCADTIPDGV